MTRQRGRRGGVSVTARSGILRLRWSSCGKRRQLSLQVSDTPYNRQLALEKAAQIEADIIKGNLDKTLNRYRIIQPAAPAIQNLAPTVALFEQFTEYKRLEGVSGQAIGTKYKALRSNIARLGRNVLTAEDARDLVQLLRERQGQLIANQNLFLLRSFGDWLVDNYHASQNLFAPIRTLKGSAPKTQDRTPFSLDELARFYPSMLLHPTASHYCDFTVVLLSLGLRPSEAIGLRWQHINTERKEITISESLSRSADGKSSGAGRERKSTKTGRIRILPMNGRLVNLFTARRSPDAKDDDLIFTSPEGHAIDDRNYRNRVWKVACAAAQVPYRPPYVARHTLLSHGLEYGGWTYRQAAYIAGHADIRTIASTYGHLLEKPELPDLGL